MQIETLQFILRAIPLKKGYTHATLLKRILKDGDHYFSNGIASEKEELDFCGIISLAIDEATRLKPDLQAELLNQIYNAAKFPHFWNG